jgi:hypothetical protein
VVVTATTGIASQGLRQKLPAISTIHKFVGSKDGRYENDELLNLIVHDENFVDIKNNIKAMGAFAYLENKYTFILIIMI